MWILNWGELCLMRRPRAQKDLNYGSIVRVEGSPPENTRVILSLSLCVGLLILASLPWASRPLLNQGAAQQLHPANINSLPSEWDIIIKVQNKLYGFFFQPKKLCIFEYFSVDTGKSVFTGEVVLVVEAQQRKRVTVWARTLHSISIKILYRGYYLLVVQSRSLTSIDCSRC